MSFSQLLDTFIPKVQQKSKQVNLATWLLETTGSKDAADLKASLDVELKMLFHDEETFKKLEAYDKENLISDPILKRQLNVLIRTFKPNLAPKHLFEKIAAKETELALEYANFRPSLNGQFLSENDIRNILKNDVSKENRLKAWEASKEIGPILSSKIIELVKLRNECAIHLGYNNFFDMQLKLQEVDEKWLFKTLDNLAIDSDEIFTKTLDHIYECLAKRFNVHKEEIGPWAFSEPFCQEDPLDSKELDLLCESCDFILAATNFYDKLGFDVRDILKNSDNYERPGKNQHAFCINIDRLNDVRTLNNLAPSIKWLETLLHELGHAIYELNFDHELPWLLKEPPHMITTEAIALLAGRQAYRKQSLDLLVGKNKEHLKQKAEESLKRRQLIFSRWVLVMTYFERDLYTNPDQDLNTLWWSYVKKYQKISSSGSSWGCDWACKYHIGLAPVYYFSYLLGELFASCIEEKFPNFHEETTGKYLKEKIFKPANRLSFYELIKDAVDEELTSKSWIHQFVHHE
jgi:peptidyl-dipeptidase A